MKEFKDLKIAVAGTGYVGLSLAVLLAQHHQVTALDIVPEKVEMINNKKSPIRDEYIEKYLAEKELDLTATLDAKEAYSDADFVVIAAPTNYDSKKNFFDTSAVEAVIKLVIEYNPEAIMVIKSTIPVGFTASVREKYHGGVLESIKSEASYTDQKNLCVRFFIRFSEKVLLNLLLEAVVKMYILLKKAILRELVTLV